MKITKNYKETLEKGLEENAASTKVCYNACNTIIKSLQKLLEKRTYHMRNVKIVQIK